MKQTVNLQALVEALATKTATDQELVEHFVRALTEEATSMLASGEHVDLPGIGTFAVENLGAETRVSWRPAHTISEQVNAPFSAFEPVALAPDVTEQMLNDIEPQATPESEPEPETISEPKPEPEMPPIPTESTIIPDTPVVTEITQPTPQTELQDEVSKPEEADTEDYVTDEVEETGSSGAGWWAFIIVLAIIIGYVIATYLPNPLRAMMEPKIIEETEMVDTIATVIEPAATDTTHSVTDSTTTPAKAPTATTPVATTPVVTDTVRQGRFLATMARSHYGSYKFWVYIYRENADRIPNPDNVPVGTVLVIPPAAKYDIDAHDPASIARAEAEIKRLSGQ